MKRFSAFSVVIILTASTLFGQNLVQNGDFTLGTNPDGFSSWEAAGTITLVNEADQGSDKAWVYGSFYGGAWSDVLAIQSSSAGGAGEGVSQQVALTDDEVYTLSFKYGYTNIGSYSTVSISYLDSAENPIAGSYYQWSFDWTTEPDPNPSDVVYSNSSYGLIEKVVYLFRGQAVSGNSWTIPENAAYMVISLKQHYTGYRTYFDDISLTAGANLISNGDFSQGSNPYGLDNWYAVGALTLVNEADAGTEKAWVSSIFTNTDVLFIQTSSNDGNGKGIQQYAYIGDADKYTLSFKYGYTNIGSYSSVSISYRDSSGNAIPGAGWFQWAFDWTTEPDPNPSDSVNSNSSAGLIEKTVKLTRGAPVSGNSTTVPDTAAYIYITLKQHYTGYRSYFDDVTLLPMPEECGMYMTDYLPGDINKDCEIDIADFADFATGWLKCTEPTDPNCDKYWK